jgi:hypothetical protein
MYFLCKNEYRIFKVVEITIEGAKVERRKIEEMNQFGLKHLYAWKCHKETPCILRKKNVIFFLL